MSKKKKTLANIKRRKADGPIPREILDLYMNDRYSLIEDYVHRERERFLDYVFKSQYVIMAYGGASMERIDKELKGILYNLCAIVEDELKRKAEEATERELRDILNAA